MAMVTPAAAEEVPSTQTNTVLVKLAPGMSLQATKEYYSWFGDVSDLQRVPGNDGIIAVVFFDVRAAHMALKNCPSDQCQAWEQVGSRTVTVDGTLKPTSTLLRQVHFMSKDNPHKEDSFTLHFYDVRDATQARKLFAAEGSDAAEDWEAQVPKTSSSADLEPPPGLAPPPGLETHKSKSKEPSVANKSRTRNKTEPAPMYLATPKGLCAAPAKAQLSSAWPPKAKMPTTSAKPKDHGFAAFLALWPRDPVSVAVFSETVRS
eukprot:gnl/TRDRNA2_/TRDRNA2_163161_c2_seq1.p1 gnl/TRDRNA2_/TRDRNA2_163161_c2~~gnl/TRDRNA2_/TRDRNA2_163161_c2_seq1.p1  ORF type:complete len:262 (-),score=44.12 gnl/TRDRNA2_/TRDRNA2_163161_c2_seq1:45-830(-)